MNSVMERFHPERVYFNRCRDDLAAKIADNRIFPVRVIDLRATLDSNGGIVFVEPKDWNFHTISHTWSLEIRQFSEEIGIQLVQGQHVDYAEASLIEVLFRRVLSTGQGRRGLHTKVSYNEVFKHAKLGDRPAYGHLLEFLEILRGDGVERAWFDALCINQADNEEKSHEIVHMGAFYCHSLGCYVMPCGFGQGFRILDKEHHLPRWFSRVWTLQEFLLPKRLTFVVELDKPQFHRVVSVTRLKHMSGGCDCSANAAVELTTSACNSSISSVGRHSDSSICMWRWGSEGAELEGTPSCLLHGSPSLSTILQSVLDNSELHTSILSRPVEDADEAAFWQALKNSHYKCTHGRLKRLMLGEWQGRHAGGGSADDEKRLYLVDRDAYVHIVLHLDDVSDDSGIIGMMARFWNMSCASHSAVVREISARNFSNEEDRVLSVLGLLGLDGKMPQLRTGQTLDIQIVEMCKAMAKHNLRDLIVLLASFEKPWLPPHESTLPGLSWAPHFRSTAHSGLFEELLMQNNEFRHAVARVHVSPEGLSLSCNALKGRLVPLLQHRRHCTRGSKFFHSGKKVACDHSGIHFSQSSSCFVLELRHCSHALTFCAAHSREPISLQPSQFSLERASKSVLAGAMELDLDNNVGWSVLPHKVQINVWLLLLGTYNDRHTVHDPLRPHLMRAVLVFMVCVGETSNNLQKIGIVKLLPTSAKTDARSTIHFDSFESVECNVGGFEKRGWKPWIFKQVQNSPSWSFS